MAESIKVLVPEEEVDARIRALGEQISKDYEDSSDLCAEGRSLFHV
jgi:hypoxanthine-guanine phosphoribosyltransferase